MCAVQQTLVVGRDAMTADTATAAAPAAPENRKRRSEQQQHSDKSDPKKQKLIAMEQKQARRLTAVEQEQAEQARRLTAVEQEQAEQARRLTAVEQEQQLLQRLKQQPAASSQQPGGGQLPEISRVILSVSDKLIAVEEKQSTMTDQLVGLPTKDERQAASDAQGIAQGIVNDRLDAIEAKMHASARALS